MQINFFDFTRDFDTGDEVKKPDWADRAAKNYCNCGCGCFWHDELRHARLLRAAERRGFKAGALLRISRRTGHFANSSNLDEGKMTNGEASALRKNAGITCSGKSCDCPGAAPGSPAIVVCSDSIGRDERAISHMTDEELEAIEQRAKAFLPPNECGLCTDPTVNGYLCEVCRKDAEDPKYTLPRVVELAGDVPALIAEVRRLRDGGMDSSK